MPRERGEKVVATNRRARHDYTIEKTYEAGLVLTGTEVKSLRQGRANLSDGYAYIDGGRRSSTPCTSRSTRRGTGRTTPRSARASCCCTRTRSIKLVARRLGGRLHARPAEALLLRRARQGRDRARQGQARVRQASDAARAPGQARGRARDALETASATSRAPQTAPRFRGSGGSEHPPEERQFAFQRVHDGRPAAESVPFAGIDDVFVIDAVGGECVADRFRLRGRHRRGRLRPASAARERRCVPRA